MRAAAGAALRDARRLVARTLLEAGVTRPAVTRLRRQREQRIILRSKLFDRGWYEAQVGSTFSDDREAVSHYLSQGRRAGRSPHPLFEPEWWAQSGTEDADPFARFLEGGWLGGRSAHPLLDLDAWSSAQAGAEHEPYGTWGHLARTSSVATVLPVQPLVEHAEPARVTLGDLEAAERRSRVVGDRVVPASLPRPPSVGSDGGPTLSAVLPVRDWRAGLHSLAAFRAQEMPDWEALVVVGPDSGAAADALSRVAGDDARIRLVQTTDESPARARRAGLAASAAPFVAMLREGDVPSPASWGAAVAALEEEGVVAAWAGSDPLPGDPVGDVGLLVVRRDMTTVPDVESGASAEMRHDVEGDADHGLDVDDLAWRLAARGRLVRLSLPQTSTRKSLSGTALAAARDAFRARWTVPRPAGSPTAGLLSVLVAADDDWRRVRACLVSLLQGAGELRLEVVLVDTSTRPDARRLLRSLALADPRVRHVRGPAGAGEAMAWCLATSAAAGDRVTLLNAGVLGEPGWLTTLLRHLEEPSVAAVAPLALQSSGTVRLAGLALLAAGGLPTPLLQDHPVEDARRAGPLLRVAATGAGVLLLRTPDLLALGGTDPLLGRWAEVDLGLRLVGLRGGDLLVDAMVEVVTDDLAGVLAGPPEEQDLARGAIRHHWHDASGPHDHEVLAGAGLTVSGHLPMLQAGGHPDLRIGVPLVVRPARSGPSGTPCLRWSIKIAAPAGPEARRWGDLYFARALAAALERRGQEVVIDHSPAVGRTTAYLDDVSLVLRGRDRVASQPGTLNLLWVISHPELVDDDELASADAVFAASQTWSRHATRRRRRPVETLLQATDTTLFNPAAGQPGSGDAVLFVGNSRGVYRPVVRHLVEAGVDVAVYGGRWAPFLPPGVLRADHVPNVELPARYASAGVVVNDHWEGMRREGFLSNRLFDAAATGARVVTDDVPGVEEALPGLVRVYRTPQELLSLVQGRETAFPSDDERRLLAARVVQEHSFDARAGVLVGTATRLWERQALSGGAGRRAGRQEE